MNKDILKEIVVNLTKATESDNIVWIKKKFTNQWNEKYKTLKAYDENGMEFLIEISWVLVAISNWQRRDASLRVKYRDIDLQLSDYVKKEVDDLVNLLISKYYSDFILDDNEFRDRLNEINSNITKLNRDKKIEKIIK